MTRNKALLRLLLTGVPHPDDRGCVPEPPLTDERACYPDPPLSREHPCYPDAPTPHPRRRVRFP